MDSRLAAPEVADRGLRPREQRALLRGDGHNSQLHADNCSAFYEHQLGTSSYGASIAARSFINIDLLWFSPLTDVKGGGGPGAVVKTACLESRRSRARAHSDIQVSKKLQFLPRSLVNIQYWGEPVWPRGSVLGLIPSGFEFRILCLKDTGGSPVPV